MPQPCIHLTKTAVQIDNQDRAKVSEVPLEMKPVRSMETTLEDEVPARMRSEAVAGAFAVG